MSRANRHRAMKCVAGPGAWLTLGDKLALVLIGDLVADGNHYYEAQQSLADRMGSNRRSAGRIVQKLVRHGALRFLGWMRTDAGATVKTFAFEPELLTPEVGQDVAPQVGEDVAPPTDDTEIEVGHSEHLGATFHAPRWDISRAEEGAHVPQTGKNLERTETEPRQAGGSAADILHNQPPDDIENERQRQLKELKRLGATYATR